MKGSTEVVKGRLEEAAGVLTGNDKLRTKGRTRQAVGHVKQAAEEGIRTIEAGVRRIIDKT